jgi:hypothetical protein
LFEHHNMGKIDDGGKTNEEEAIPSRP